MIKLPKLLLILVPAILIAGLALFVRVIQYKPARLSINDTPTTIQKIATIPIYPEDPILGYKKAPSNKTLIIFEDFGCEACAAETKTLNDLLIQYPKNFKIIIKGLPVTKFPVSTDLGHEYAFCLNKQKQFDNFSQLAFGNGNNLTSSTLRAIVKGLDVNEKDLQNCLASTSTKDYLEMNKLLATALNIQAVPAVFLDNQQIIPPTDLEGWKTILGL